MIVYIETSAFLKLVKQEVCSAALRGRFVELRRAGNKVVSSALLAAEAHRAAQRMPSLDQVSVTKALPQVGLVTIDSATVRAAGMLPGPYLRTLDAIHVATAIELEADIVLAYDRRVLEAAASQGLVTEYPGGAH